MTKHKLVIAEKPSVAQSIAKVIGANKHCDGYLEGNGYIVSWCLGHLIELAPPDFYNEIYARWRYEDLPILPQTTDQGWTYQVSKSTRKQFSVLQKLMKDSSVDSICLATDAAREGELIGRLVYHQCHCTKPMERLWISSMEDDAIREGFRNLKPSSEYDALYEAALCRERADWIVGINATRLFSCLHGQTLQVGRVMTPTLAMVVLRDAEITGFHSEPFYTVEIQLDDFSAVSEKMKSKEEAEQLLDQCRRKHSARVVEIEKRQKTEHAPALYDLTSLQREANRIFGFTAQQTLDYAQSLYEKKLITYPRTDSRYLTEDMYELLSDWIEGVSELFHETGLSNELKVRQVTNSSKVTDHHAIIPTRSFKTIILNELPFGEQQICTLIAARFEVAVSDDYRYKETTLTLECGSANFYSKCVEVDQEGWKAIQKMYLKKEKVDKELAVLPDIDEGDVFPVHNCLIKEGKTTPPKHYTEDSLLSAMENAADVPADVERKGIGTPATRAGIIEKLVQKGYISRKGDRKTKYLIATEKGTALITVVPEQIQSASMTADWEEKLLKIERGSYRSSDFMDEITEMVSGLVKECRIGKGSEILLPQKGKSIGNCPACGSEVVERNKGWFCSNPECHFMIWKENHYFRKIGRGMTPQIAEQLVKKGKVFLSGCVSARTGKFYDATVVMHTKSDGSPTYEMRFPDSKQM